jgi:AICAR transformylase/IMP cyclohydrolase PurH
MVHGIVSAVDALLSLNDGLAKIQNQGATFITNPKHGILDHRKHANSYESKYGDA